MSFQETENSKSSLKDLIAKNQRIIDKLNADLQRKNREVRIIQDISSEINVTLDSKWILAKMLYSLDETFGFNHSMVLLIDESGTNLRVSASHGYNADGIGAQVEVGQGIIGVVAKRKKLMRMGNIGSQMAYLSAVKNQMKKEDSKTAKLPGLKDLQSQVAIPLLSEGNLVGVLAVESNKPNVFDDRDQLIITILANQAASAIEKARTHEELKKLNENLEDKVKKRTAEVIQQKKIIEEKHQEITASIRYAKQIQNTILPSAKIIEEHLRESFVLFKPRDIVSGDFYWVNLKDGKVLFSVIDCTGHGVPGGFVSFVGYSGLQRAINLFKLRKPSEILDKLNEHVDEYFNKQGSANVKDGMDIAMCALDRENGLLEYAGAYNPIYLIQNGELNVFKPDKQPIGVFESKKNFNNHEIKVKPGDCIYIFSDGYVDQFGGKRDQKFTSRQLRELLLYIHQKPMKEQHQILDDTIEKWRDGKDQIDDICLMGVKV